MKTIIAPTDFSPVSYNACLYAAKMAADIEADLMLLHVMELPVSVVEFPVTEEVFDGISMAEELAEIKDKLCNETGNKVNIQTKNILGSVEYEIKELCNQKNPFLVIMGTHASGFLDRFFKGSTAVYTAKHLHYPVLIIPADLQYKPIKKIALASDLKDVYEIPAHEIEVIVKYFSAGFHIFYAGKSEKNISSSTVESLLLDHRLLSLDPEFDYIEQEDIQKGIASLIKKHDIDVLLITPRKHGPFHKSLSQDFIFHSPVPVMAIHKNDFAGQAEDA